jgi:hypothetical protein
MLVTCKNCGAQNRVGEVPSGSMAICGSCRSVLGSIESPRAPKHTAKISGAAWAWIVIFGIGLVVWITESSSSSSRKDSNYSSSSSRQLTQTPPKPAFTEPKQPLPPHGKITWFSAGDPIAPLEIRSSKGSNYLVKLSDYYSGRAVVSVFVQGGRTVNLDVPIGTYKIKYASGENWYGTTHLFGPDTSYSKADSSFDFRVIGDQISGYTLTLYKVVDGNLQTTPITPDEF